MLHALGVKHEHSRPDREQYLIVDLDKASDRDLKGELEYLNLSSDGSKKAKKKR